MSLSLLTTALLFGNFAHSLATVLGVHNAQWREDVVSQLGVKAVRGIVTDLLLMNDDRRQSLLDKIKSLSANNVDVFVSIAFERHDGVAKHRVPADGEDWDSCMTLAEEFLKDFGPYIHAIVLGNEPTNDYSLQDLAKNHTSGHMPALWWIRQLAKRVKAYKQSTNAGYKIMAPDVGIRSSAVDRFPDGLPEDRAKFIKQLVKMAHDEDLDAIDCHLHMANITILKTAVQKVKAVLTEMNASTLPLVALEWSQAPITSKSGWLKRTCNFGNLTNKEYIEQCYTNPVSEQMWAEFMKGHPYDATFMQNAFDHMKQNGFLYATYGAAFQYGNVNFDSKQLIASKTVVKGFTSLPHNEPLYSWFQYLVGNASTRLSMLV